MAVVGNTVSAIGDVLYIYSQGAVSGNVNLTGFTDTIIGETPTRYFQKTFKYSTDGVNYSNWLPLTNANIILVSGDVPGLIFFEYKYQRVGTDGTGLLEFQNIQLLGNIIIQVVNNTISLESIFEDLVNSDALTAQTANNLIKKIYKSGIIPKFIERGEGVDDTDYVSVWSAICFFLAYLSSFMHEFDTILYKRKYLSEHLKQRNIAICEEQTPFMDMQYIAKNFFDEIRKRGTQLIYKEKGSILLDGSTYPIRGEWLRLICKNHFDEFLVDVVEKHKHGWCVGQSSPMYNGTYFSKQINKTEENTEDFEDLDKYDLINPDNVFITNEGTKFVAGIIGGSGIQGFGYDLSNPPTMLLPEQLIVVDKEIDYEITFLVKRNVGTAGALYFGVTGYNRNCVLKPLSFNRIDNGLIENTFLVDSTQAITKLENEWYFVRGIIYAANSQNITGQPGQLNVNQGINLRFSSTEDVEKVKISLYTKSNSINDVYKIHDFKMRPLVRGKNSRPLTTGEVPYIKNPQFLQGSGFVLNWFRNNSNGVSDVEIQNFIEDYLLPYEDRLTQYSLTPKVNDKQVLLDIN
jgi:hypothetical protein